LDIAKVLAVLLRCVHISMGYNPRLERTLRLYALFSQQLDGNKLEEM
jgi:hypothetical protein